MSALTLVLAAVAGFMAFWAGVVSLIGFAGWKPLAARYPASRWPEGEGVRLGWQSASVGLSSYSGALNAVVTAEGLYLRPVRLFAYNHPPVFIPWGAVTDLRDGLLSGVVLGLEEGTGTLRVSGQLAEAVRVSYGAWSAAGGRRATPQRGLEGEARGDEAPAVGAWRRSRTG